MTKKSKFKPSWWLPGPHLQTLWGPLVRRQTLPPLRYERLELEDGDFIDVAWGGEHQESPLVILIHGLAGSIDSHYIPGLLRALDRKGLRTLFMHLRGCSGEPNRLPGSYHFGSTQDLDYLIQLTRNRFPNQPIAVVGFSLGGNIVLKWLGLNVDTQLVQAGVAVSVPFYPEEMVRRLQYGFGRIYQKRFVEELKKNYFDKSQVSSMPLPLEVVNEIKTLQEWDEQVTVPLYSFHNAQEYYQNTSSYKHLKNITVPTLIIQSEDDPFMTPRCIPQSEDLSSAINLELTEKGGHVGYVGGLKPWRPQYWLEERIPLFLSEYFTNGSVGSRHGGGAS